MRTSQQALVEAGLLSNAMQSLRLLNGRPELERMVSNHDTLVALFLRRVLRTEGRQRPIWLAAQYDCLKPTGKALRKLGMLGAVRGLYPSLTQRLGHPCWDIPLTEGSIRIRHDGVWEYQHGTPRAMWPMVMGRTEPMWQRNKFRRIEGYWSLYLYGPDAGRLVLPTGPSGQKLAEFLKSHDIHSELKDIPD